MAASYGQTFTGLCKWQLKSRQSKGRSINDPFVFRSPPKEQAKYERWSLVFFIRPANHVELTALAEDSALIAEAVNSAPDPAKYRTGQTAESWFTRRLKYQRIKNRTVS